MNEDSTLVSPTPSELSDHSVPDPSSVPYYLGEYIRECRERKGIRFGDIARAIGVPATGRGCRNLVSLERQQLNRKLLERVAPVIDLDLEHAAKLIQRYNEETRAARERWLDAVVPWTLHIKVMPGFWVARPIEPGTTLDAAKRVAAAESLRIPGSVVVLEISRRLKLVVHKGEHVNTLTTGETPHMKVGGTSFVVRTE
ncbi:MAG: hypothetical protein WBX15_21125 [Thermoanaerobaculia bacterium]